MNKLLDFCKQHPMIVAWIGLSIGMVAILLYTSKDVELLATQRMALIAATIGLAGACVWILTWESGDDASDEAEQTK
jgi:hypothetical protein